MNTRLCLFCAEIFPTPPPQNLVAQQWLQRFNEQHSMKKHFLKKTFPHLPAIYGLNFL